MTMDGEHNTGVPPISHAQAFETLAGSNVSMVLADPNLDDVPIVYVNRSFERITGYAANMAIGRNCRFLQGPDTDPDDVKRLREAIAAEEDVTVDLLNYRADGSEFVNRLMMTPIRGVDGKVRFILGIQKPLSEVEDMLSPNAVRHAMREVQHRVKNHLAMIVSMVRLQGRAAGEARSQFDVLARRIESLQVLYQELSNPERKRNMDTVSVGTYLSRLGAATQSLDGRAGIRMHVNVDNGDILTNDASTLGLIVSEVLTNALQHAFVGRETGTLELRGQSLNEGHFRVIVSDDGNGFPDGVTWPGRSGTGGNIMNGLIGQLGGSVDVTSGKAGSVVTLDFPGLIKRP